MLLKMGLAICSIYMNGLFCTFLFCLPPPPPRFSSSQQPCEVDKDWAKVTHGVLQLRCGGWGWLPAMYLVPVSLSLPVLFLLSGRSRLVAQLVSAPISAWRPFLCIEIPTHVKPLCLSGASLFLLSNSRTIASL